MSENNNGKRKVSQVSSDEIPNNVNLNQNRKLQKALKRWQPNFLEWWMELGPAGFQHDEVYLRTAESIDTEGWATWGFTKMPEYRWGIFLTPSDREEIHFGDNKGEEVWDEVPGQYRNELRRLIVTQGDTEPASVEQQRLLGKCAPSLYDLRNIFQINVEEGRHLWAMVYLLHNHFGRDGMDEAQQMLERHAGDEDNPRILNAFNKPIENWLDFFCFAMFTDRDGRFQLEALSESAFDPLARTTQFMLTEEAFHLFVGERGIARVIQRTCDLMQQNDAEDVREEGGIPLDMLQKFINEWFSSSLDLFGGEESSNAAKYFGASLKGRYKEDSDKRYEDHKALDQVYVLEVPDDSSENGELVEKEIPKRRAMNAILSDAYIEDCERALGRWNDILEEKGIKYELELPSRRFHRNVGIYADDHFDPDGNLISEEEWEENMFEWLPSEEDRDYVNSLMQPVYEPGKVANWIAEPRRGVNGKPIDFEYVRFDEEAHGWA